MVVKLTELVHSRLIIIFDQEMISYCETTTDLRAYFRQRIRVNEGHTRGLRRNMWPIAGNETLSLIDKVELFLNGLQYVKFVYVVGTVIINIILVIILSSDSYNSRQLMNMFEILLSLQATNLFMAIACMIWGAKICRSIRRCGVKDIVSFLVLSVIATPAFVIGSFRGFFQSEGIFYRTQRNMPENQTLTK